MESAWSQKASLFSEIYKMNRRKENLLVIQIFYNIILRALRDDSWLKKYLIPMWKMDWKGRKK
jgi:hypothetical protein